MILAGLDWLGRRGARVLPVVLLAGMAIPPLSTLAQPLLPPVVFLMLVTAFIRVEAVAARAQLRQPLLPIACVVWMMVLTPLAMGAVIVWTGLEQTSPGLAVALMLISAGAPILSTPAFAYILRLDGMLSLTVLIFGQALLPIAAPLMADLFLDEALPLSPQGLGLRLGLLLAGALIVAVPLRRYIGAERLQRHAQALDGINIVLLYLFAVAIMDGVVARFIADPWVVLGVTALAFGLMVLLLVSTVLIFLKAGVTKAVTLGISASNRNLGLFAAALVGHAPELTMIYFAVGQFPVYFLPWAIEAGMARYRRARPAAAG